MDIPLTRLKSIPPEAIEKFASIGITTLQGYYDQASHNDTRAKLSQQTGIPELKLVGWSTEAGNIIMMAGINWSK